MGPGFALYAVLDFVADHYQPIVAQFEKDFDAIETDIFKDQFDRLVIERLYALKRDLLELRNAALPAGGDQLRTDAPARGPDPEGAAGLLPGRPGPRLAAGGAASTACATC